MIRFKEVKAIDFIKLHIAGLTIILLFGCSSSENVTLRKYEVVEQLRGQPEEIYVRTSNSELYLFSHSNYYILNDTLFGKGYLLTNEEEILFKGDFILTNIKSIEYYYDPDYEQNIEIYYDPERDSVIGYKIAGAKAYIEMNDGRDFTGELLAVRDSTMIICEEYEADEQELVDSVYSIYVLNNYDIKLIELKVGNYTLTGVIIGYLSPLVLAINPNNKGNPGVGLLAAAISIVGSIIGGIIGANITDYEPLYEYTTPNQIDFKQLKIYARYVNNEPEFLKMMK